MAMCENGYMYAQIEGAKAAHMSGLWMWLGISALIVVFALASMEAAVDFHEKITNLTTDWF
jgi:hypothetical protein